MRVKVCRPVLSMHREPDGESERVSQALYGIVVKKLEEQGAWALIETPDGYRGWASGEGVVPYSQPEHTPQHWVCVQSLYAHVYAVQDTEPHPPLITLPFEVVLEAVRDDADQIFRECVL